MKSRDDYLDCCIWIDPGRQSGAPCLGGTRIPVEMIVDLMADRDVTEEQVMTMYPSITREHLKAVRWWDEEGRASVVRAHRRSRRRRGRE